MRDPLALWEDDGDCGRCEECGELVDECECDAALFDADELGLNPEDDDSATDQFQPSPHS